MELCSNGHDEVCYHVAKCPACLLKDERDDAQDELRSAEKKIDRLEAEVDELNKPKDD